MIYLEQNIQEYTNDFRAMIMAFFTGEGITESPEEGADARVKVKAYFDEEGLDLEVTMGENGGNVAVKIPGDYKEKEAFRNSLKKGIYRVLSGLTGRKLPWGDLTGVRPTKIAMAQLKSGATEEETIRYYKETYDTGERKAALATRVAKEELSLLSGLDLQKDYCLYIGIPFCPSRCLYCSFTSYPIARYKKRAAEYVEKLSQELKTIAKKMEGRHLAAVYIGGGTPSSLNEQLTEELMRAVNAAFPDTESGNTEFTVEAGRADSITRRKLVSYKKHGVTRVSINPQTMNNETLRTIGRAHTAEQAEEAFSIAREVGFDNINMDIIAGLPGEGLSHMEHTLSRIRALNPESLTVHSLAIKRAANLNKEFEAYGGAIHHEMEEQLAAVEAYAEDMGLVPYYLYRQKNIGGNLENIGYAKPGKACMYNILIMEELVDIMAAGAGGATKLVRVERIANPKQVEDYLSRFDEIIQRKEAIQWQ